MLQEIPGVTPSGAIGIAHKYKSFAGLMSEFRRVEREEGKETARGMVADCQVRLSFSFTFSRLCLRVSGNITTGKTTQEWGAEREEDRPGCIETYLERFPGTQPAC